MALTVGGLFSGIGGWELGLERAGMEIAWHCEADPFCQRVLEKHWPGVPCYGDVCGLTGADVRPVDVLCGGFPCQDISLAGKGAGIDGARSGLWSEYARLIGELRPRYVCVENVSALLGRGLDRVLADLSALGFDAEWDCIPASAIGAHHQRDRVWLVAYPRGARRRQDAGSAYGHESKNAGWPAQDDHESFGVGSQRLQASGWEAGLAETNHARRIERRQPEPDAPKLTATECGGCKDVADAPSVHVRDGYSSSDPFAEGGEARAVSIGGSQRSGALGGQSWWAVEPDVGRVAYGVPARVDRLRSLGNALVPQIAQWIGERIVSYEASLNGVGMERP